MIANVADNDDFCQPRIVLRQQRRHGRPDRALAVLHRDDYGDVGDRFRLACTLAVTHVAGTGERIRLRAHGSRRPRNGQELTMPGIVACDRVSGIPIRYVPFGAAQRPFPGGNYYLA